MIDMRTGTCALCEHNEVIEASARDFFGESGERSEQLAVSSMPKSSMVGGTKPDPEKRRGRLVQYVCRSCGYTQWFALNPTQIPIGYPHETRIVEGAAKAPPYR